MEKNSITDYATSCDGLYGLLMPLTGRCLFLDSNLRRHPLLQYYKTKQPNKTTETLRQGIRLRCSEVRHIIEAGWSLGLKTTFPCVAQYQRDPS